MTRIIRPHKEKMPVGHRDKIEGPSRHTGCSLNIVFFLVIFLNSASSAAALVFYLPGVCTHTDAAEGRQRKARVRNIFKNSEKTQYLMI